MGDKKPTLNYESPLDRQQGYFATYWHLYAPFVIVLLIIVFFASAAWWGIVLVGRNRDAAGTQLVFN